MVFCIVHVSWDCCIASVGVPVGIQMTGFVMVSCVVCVSWGCCIVSDGVPVGVQ